MKKKQSLSSFIGRIAAMFCLSLLLAQCSKDPVAVDDTATGDTTEAQKRQQAIDDYRSLYLTSNTTASWTGSVSACSAGAVSTDMHTKTLKRINFYRKLVGLPYNMQFTTLLNEKAQKAALMMEANNRLDHFPTSAWACYTADGAAAAGQSNLAQGGIGSGAIDLYMQDFGTGNEAVGHRRWLLFTRAKTFGHGSTNTFNAIYCLHNFSNPGLAPSLTPDFIAYPPKGYVVKDLFVPQQRWSFSIPDADFSTVSVTVKNADNIQITTVPYPIQSGYGDNTFVFVPTINSYAFAKDTKYSVEIKNVKVNGVLKTYNYDVTFVKM